MSIAVLPAAIGALLIAFGANAVMTAAGSPVLVGYGYVLGGIALLCFRNRARHARIRMMLGGAIVLMATTALAGPAARDAACLLISGGSLACLPRMRSSRARFLVAAALLAVVLVGAAGGLDYLFDQVLLHEFAPLAQVSPYVPATLFPVALLCDGLVGRRLALFFSEREDRQVLLVSGVLSALMVLVAGTVVGLILTRHYLVTFEETLRIAHHANLMLFQNTLDMARLRSRSDLLTDTRLLQQLAAGVPDAALQTEIRRLARRSEDGGFTAIAIHAPDGRLRAGTGSFQHQGPQAMHTPQNDGALSWDRGWLWAMRIPLYLDGRHLGDAVVERSLPRLDRQFDYTEQLGRTGEVLACTLAASAMDCFPSRLVQRVHREPLRFGGQRIPMGQALDGERGVGIYRDYRGVKVVSAFGLVPGTRIGLVQKIDVDDLFATVRQRLVHAALFLIALSLAGAGLLSRFVRPIVRDLVRTRKHLTAVLDNVPSAIVLAGGDGVIKSVNRAGETIFGAPTRRMAGRPLSEFLPDIPALPQAQRATLEGCRWQGVRFPAQVYLDSLVLDRGLHYLCIVRDVTDLSRMEIALHESQERLLAIAANIPGMVFQCLQRVEDKTVHFTYVSRGIERLLALPVADPLAESRAILRRLSGGDVTRFIETMSTAGAARRQLDWEGRLPDAEQADRWIKLGATPRLQRNGDIIWDGVAYDITSIKREQQHLEQSESSLRRLAAHIETAREDERKRIAAEIHDELGQTLTGLRMNLSMLQHDLAAATPELKARLAAMKNLVDRTIATARHVITSLRPPVLDLGIHAALAWLVADFSAHSGVDCRLHLADADIELDEDRAVALFRIVQEALTNIGRHAGARRASVLICRRPEALLIRIDDNGGGFDSDRIDREKSFGLAGMRERLLNLKGRLSVTSVPGKGTRLRIRLPTAPRQVRAAHHAPPLNTTEPHQP